MRKDAIRELLAKEHPGWQLVDDEDEPTKRDALRKAAHVDLRSPRGHATPTTRPLHGERKTNAVDGNEDEGDDLASLRARFLSHPAEANDDATPVPGGDDDDSDAIVRLRTPNGSVMRAIVTKDGIVAHKG
jgi:hypothetical protein